MNEIVKYYVDLKEILPDLTYKAEQAINIKSEGETEQYFPHDYCDDEDVLKPPQSILNERDEIVEERAVSEFLKDYNIFQSMQEKLTASYHRDKAHTNLRMSKREYEEADRMQLKLNKFFRTLKKEDIESIEDEDLNNKLPSYLEKLNKKVDITQ